MHLQIKKTAIGGFSLFAGAPRRIAFAAAEAGRAEFAYGEGHRLEKLAGVGALGLYTLLLGNAVFRRVYEILGGALDADYGEKSEGNYELFVFRVAKVTAADTAAYGFGNITALTAAAHLVGGAYYLRVKYDGVNGLKHCDGKV